MWKKRNKKKNTRNVTKISLLITAFLVSGLTLTIFKLGIFSVKQIEAEVTDGCVDAAQVENASGILGQNFFFLKTPKIAADLKKKFFCLKTVTVNKYFPDKAQLLVTARQPLAALFVLKEETASPSAKPEEAYLTDNEGMVFAKGKGDLNIPQVFVYNLKTSLGEKVTGAVLNSLIILDKIKTLGFDVEKSIISDNNFVIIAGLGKPQIIFHLEGDIDIQLVSLQLISDKAKIDLKELEFIDLRFDKPVVRFAPQKKKN